MSKNKIKKHSLILKKYRVAALIAGFFYFFLFASPTVFALQVPYIDSITRDSVAPGSSGAFRVNGYSEPGNLVTIYCGKEPFGLAETDSSGNFSIFVQAPLHADCLLYVRADDGVQESLSSKAVNLTVDSKRQPESRIFNKYIKAVCNDRDISSKIETVAMHNPQQQGSSPVFSRKYSGNMAQPILASSNSEMQFIFSRESRSEREGKAKINFFSKYDPAVAEILTYYSHAPPLVERKQIFAKGLSRQKNSFRQFSAG
ncbi:hypothetical protein ACFL35_16565 [Candidatus Riflebacteria bacterium]